MKHFLLILKLLFKNVFSFKRKSSEKMKRSTVVLLIVGIGITYLFVMGSILTAIAFAAPHIKEAGFLSEFMVMCYAIGGVIVLIFGALSLLNTLYFSRDSEFFLALPIKSSTIFLAKFAYVYIVELIIVSALLLPVLVTIAIAARMSFLFYVMIPIGVIIAPAFPLLLSTFLMVPLMYIVTFFKNRKAFTSIFAIVFFGAAYAVYFYFIFRNSNEAADTDITQVLESMRATLVTLSNVLYPYLALARLATLTNIFGYGTGMSALINAAIFLGSCLALLGLAIFVSKIIYVKGAANQLETQKKKSTGKEKYIHNSKLKALMKKEWCEVIRTPYFAFQCFAGTILTPVLVVMLCVNFRGSLTVDVDIWQFDLNTLLWYVGLGTIIMLGIGMNFFASTAITREGKNFYFSKMMPVAYKEQLKAKLCLSTIVSIVSAIPSLVIMTITLKEYLLLVPSIVFTAIYSLGFNCLAIYVDLTKPKLEWTTPQQAMKQNFRASIPYIINTLISGGVFFAMPILCTIALKPLIGGLIIWVFNYAFASLVAIVFWTILFSHADACYERLSV